MLHQLIKHRVTLCEHCLVLACPDQGYGSYL